MYIVHGDGIGLKGSPMSWVRFFFSFSKALNETIAGQ